MRISDFRCQIHFTWLDLKIHTSTIILKMNSEI